MKKEFRVQSLEFRGLIFIFSLFTIYFSLFTEVEAKIYIDINAPSFRRLPIAVTDFRDLGETTDREGHGKKIAEVIRDDLDFSGFFDLLDPASFIEDPKKAGITEDRIDFKDWSTVGAEALVKGGIILDGQRLTVEARLFDVFQGRLITGKRYTGEVKDIRKIAHRFSNEIVKSFIGEDGIFETSIAFVVNSGGSKDIYIMDYDGHNMRRLTNSGSLNLSPSWSPDGTKIVFSSERGRSWWIFSIDRKTKEEKRLTFERGLNMSPSFSPQGDRIAFSYSKDGNSDIYIMESNNMKRITNHWTADISPSWSPDGKSIAFVSDRAGSPQIYIMDSNGENVRRITFEGSYNVSPSWSPRGDKIAFASRINGKFEICIINPDGSGLHQLTSTGNNEDPSWSPDGRYIVFSSKRNGRTGIYTMKANGETQRLITPKEITAEGPAWSFRPQ
jgi:TolB protein